MTASCFFHLVELVIELEFRALHPKDSFVKHDEQVLLIRDQQESFGIKFIVWSSQHGISDAHFATSHSSFGNIGESS